MAPSNNDLKVSRRIPSVKKRNLSVFAAFVILVILYTIRMMFFQSSPTTHILTSQTPAHISARPLTSPPQIAVPSNVATIIEARPLTSLAPLILHFATVLGPAWPIVVFTADPSTTPVSAPFQRAVQSGRIHILALPSNISFHIREEVSEFLTSPWIWEALAPAPHVLLFQADSIICANAQVRVEDFLVYDFVGAPIKPGMGHGDVGMNGGLSLRNRTLILEIIHRWNWKEERMHALDPEFPPIKYEDQWFYKKMITMNNEAASVHGGDGDTEGRNWGNGSDKARLPTVEEAMKFSVETIWYDQPLGYHQVGEWHWDRVAEIDRWCPEHRMATKEKISN